VMSVCYLSYELTYIGRKARKQYIEWSAILTTGCFSLYLRTGSFKREVRTCRNSDGRFGDARGTVGAPELGGWNQDFVRLSVDCHV